MKERSNEKELMDGPLENPQLLYKNFDELIVINRWTASYSRALQSLLKMTEGQSKPIVIADIGFGAGDFLYYLYENREKFSCEIKWVGLDMESHAIEYAKTRYPQMEKQVEWIESGYTEWFRRIDKVDIVCLNLFCHHLSDEEIIELLDELDEKVQLGFLINDLHRHPIAYHFIKVLTYLFSGSKYTKNDAPLSVLRSFKRADWVRFLEKSKIANKNWDIQLDWIWTFRYFLTAHRKEM